MTLVHFLLPAHYISVLRVSPDDNSAQVPRWIWCILRLPLLTWGADSQISVKDGIPIAKPMSRACNIRSAYFTST